MIANFGTTILSQSYDSAYAGTIAGTITTDYSDLLLIVKASVRNELTLGTLRYAGTAMTKVDAAAWAYGTEGAYYDQQLWYLKNPPSGASSLTWYASGTAFGDIAFVGAYFYNLNNNVGYIGSTKGSSVGQATLNLSLTNSTDNAYLIGVCGGSAAVTLSDPFTSQNNIFYRNYLAGSGANVATLNTNPSGNMSGVMATFKSHPGAIITGEI